jgi:hypothetical protein
LVKSVKRAKFTVAGAAEVISETACPPPCGTRLAEVIVATNDSTSHMGASVPKVTTDPVCAGVVETELIPPFDPHPTISATAKTTATPDITTQLILLMLPS